MSRIFISLSLLPIVLIVATMSVGWWIGDYNQAFASVRAETDQATAMSAEEVRVALAPLETPQNRFKWHFQLGLATSLSVVLINSLSVTYLIGTSRWVSEVSEAYGLSQVYAQKSNQLKRHTFPWSIGGVLAILTIIGLGAASDPGTLRSDTAEYVLPHLLSAMVGASFIIWAIMAQAFNLHRNSLVIEEVVAQVQQARTQRGLEVG